MYLFVLHAGSSECGLKLRKKLETTGFDTVTQAQNYLKLINKKLKLWHLESLGPTFGSSGM